MAADVLQFALELTNAPSDDASIRLELSLSRSAQAHASRATASRASTCLASEVCPRAREAGQTIDVLGKLYLQGSFTRPSMPGENVEDEGSTVQDLDPQLLLKPTLLARREFVIKDDRVQGELVGNCLQLGDLALAYVGARVDRRQPLPSLPYNLCASRARQFGQLGQGIIQAPATPLFSDFDAYEEDPFGATVPAE